MADAQVLSVSSFSFVLKLIFFLQSFPFHHQGFSVVWFVFPRFFSTAVQFAAVTSAVNQQKQFCLNFTLENNFLSALSACAPLSAFTCSISLNDFCPFTPLFPLQLMDTPVPGPPQASSLFPTATVWEKQFQPSLHLHLPAPRWSTAASQTSELSPHRVERASCRW